MKTESAHARPNAESRRALSRAEGCFGVRWQSEAATPLFTRNIPFQKRRGAARIFPKLAGARPSRPQRQRTPKDFEIFLGQSVSARCGRDGRAPFSLRLCRAAHLASPRLIRVSVLVAASRLCVFAFILLPLFVSAATNDLTSALQRGLFEE